MRLLITGGVGFIGSNYINWHLQQYPGDEIVCLDKLTYAANMAAIFVMSNLSKVVLRSISSTQ